MVQIQLFKGLDAKDLQDQVNGFLKMIDSEAVKDIRTDLEKNNAVILYEMVEEWSKRKCYDCKYWDDGGDPSSTSGFCIECGGRRRFNCKACKNFKDERGGK